MLVGKCEVDVSAVEAHAHTVEEFCDFCDSLIPEAFRYNKCIRDNQRYICCMYLRKSKKLTWDKKKEFINKVLSKCRVVGYADKAVSVDEIYMYIDMQKVYEYLGASCIMQI